MAALPKPSILITKSQQGATRHLCHFTAYAYLLQPCLVYLSDLIEIHNAFDAEVPWLTIEENLVGFHSFNGFHG